MARRPLNTPYTITNTFGVADSNAYFGYHSGVDYAVPVGRAVFAPAKSRVHWAGPDNTGGNMLVLFDGKYYHRLLHNSKLRAYTGWTVNEGTHIADSGSTGLSTGPHVHWDIFTELAPGTRRPPAFSYFKDPAVWLKENTMAMTATEKKYYDLGKKCESQKHVPQLGLDQTKTLEMVKAHMARDPYFKAKIDAL
jgi:murein DD-endopeptidase MepM/ murein hydrolase activator NlpD